MQAKILLPALFSVAALMLTGSLFAQTPIAYEIAFPASGSVAYTSGGTQDFSNANTVLTVYSNTSKVTSQYIQGTLVGYVNNGNPATIVIDGVGSFVCVNFTVSDSLGNGKTESTLEFLQSSMPGAQTVTLTPSAHYNLQTSITLSGSLNTSYFGTGSFQSKKGTISFSESDVTGVLYGRLGK